MHTKFKLVFVLATALSAVSPAFSQKPFDHMSLGIKVSSLGYGFEAATPLHRMLTLRLGLNLTSGINFGNMFDVGNIGLADENGKFADSFGYIPDLKITPDINLTHANLLLDFHPAGIFNLTVGAFMGTSKLIVDGYLIDRSGQKSVLQQGKTWPVIDVGNQHIDLTDGRATVDLQLGNSFKPYLGLGLGRAVPKNRLSFKFELGIVFQKGYTLRQNGVVFDLKTAGERELSDFHDTLSKVFLLNYWPMINFQLSYRIF